jgi:hypothetical protein
MLLMGSIRSTERRNKDLKVVKYYEFDLEDQDEMFTKWAKYLEKAAKNPEKYPTYISGPDGHSRFEDTVNGVSIMEIENEEQLINYCVELCPPLRARFELLFDGNKYVQAYMAKKK